MKIAIVGMAFRFPGDLSTEEAFWDVLKSGRDVVGEVGEDRWATGVLSHPKRSEPGRSVTFSAGVLSRLDEFDAAFFGISPREAMRLDPQQRLLLEMAWEAMENGGLPPARLAGSNCAVYVGISGLDYGMRALDDLSGMDAYSMTGNTLSIAANRLSYVFDLHGPSMAVDTACSSSLVALHQAVRCLQGGDAPMAMVGGVNLLLHPYPFIGFTKASMLSAGGRCKTFDAAGDGYVRAEGGAVLLLKPLEQAEADGDDIQAIILASGANSDGGRKTGITIPSVEGQSDLLRQVLREAGISPDGVDYMEAHGTGTAVGDPIETAAIGQVLGRARLPGKPLPVGSVKSNLGHLEPASGMAGLVKTVLAIKRRCLPPSIHLETPNPNIDFSALNLEVVSACRPLPDQDRALCMGVNSFGFGGANAHVLLQEYRGRARRRGRKKSSLPLPLVLSARSGQALKALAERYAVRIGGPDRPNFNDLAYAAAYRRQWLEKRLVLTGDSAGQVAERLAAYARGERVEGLVEEDALAKPGKTAFIYSGNGAQWLGMGRSLLAESAAFAEHMAELDALLRAPAGFSLLAELQAEPEQSRLACTEVAQPLLFAMQVAITRLLRAQGLDAAAAAGHSVGEVAAAWATGALSLEQAVRVICERSAAQALTRGEGRMAALGLSEEAAREALHLAGLAHDLEVAAINSPGAVTVTGPLQALAALGARMEAQGTFYRLLDLDYAFHSRAMDPIQGRVAGHLADLAPSAGQGVFVSTVTGGILSGERLEATYWWDNIRQPVRFDQAVGTLLDAGCRLFVEIGPHAILQRYIGESLSARGVAGRVLSTLKRDDDGPGRLTETALRALLLGVPFDLERYFARPAGHVRLPNYPWQRERHWHVETSEGYDLINRRRVHPLLGYRLKEAEAVWENPLDVEVLPYLADHKVGGAVVLPGAAYVEMALAASREWFGHQRHELEELDILAPVVFDGEHARMLRFELSVADGGFRIRSRQRLSQDDWTLNAVGRLLGEPLARRPAGDPTATGWLADGSGLQRGEVNANKVNANKVNANKVNANKVNATEVNATEVIATEVIANEVYEKEAHADDWRGLEPGAVELPAATHYDLAMRLGLVYGPVFQGLERVWVRGDGLQARLNMSVVAAASLDEHVLHPAVLDVCYQSLLDFFHADILAGRGITLLPVKVGRLRFYGGGRVAGFRARLLRRSPRSVLAEFQLLDATGETVVELQGCRFRAAALGQRGDELPALWRHDYRLQPHPDDVQVAALAASDELARQAVLVLTELEPVLHRRDYFLRIAPLLDALVSAFAFQALHALSEKHGDGPRLALDCQAGMAPEILPLFNWLLKLLAAEGLLARRQDHWRLLLEDAPPAAAEVWRAILGDAPNVLPDLVLAGRVGRHLAGLLRGDVDRAAFSKALLASHLHEQCFDASPTYLGMKRAAIEIVGALADAWPMDRRLRILEISDGTDGLPRLLLPRLPERRCDYVIAKQEGEKLARLELEYAGHPVIAVATLDGGAGLTLSADRTLPAHYDVVVVEHWLHRVPDIAPILIDIKRKLAPGGLLLLLERHPDRVADLQYGLDPGWWHEAGGELRVSSLLPPAGWSALLNQQGFEQVHVLREPAAEDYDLGAFAVLAKNATHIDEALAPKPESWLLVTDAVGPSRSLAEGLADSLHARGQTVTIAMPDVSGQVSGPPGPAGIMPFEADSATAYGELLARAQQHPLGCDHVVNLLGLRDAERPAEVDAGADPSLRCTSALRLVQAMASLAQTHPCRLWLVTAGASVMAAMPDTWRHLPDQAPLLGFGRVIMNEHPELQCTLLDVQPDCLADAAPAWLTRELLAPDGENEVVLTRQGRFVPRLEAEPVLEPPPPRTPDAGFRLDFSMPGRLGNLRWRELSPRALAEDEVEIRPAAVGLNFRDVMYAMGLLSDEAVENGFSGASLGLELAGRVTRVGAAVADFRPGDEVVAFAPACFSSHVLTKSASVAAKPPAWSFEEAATVPTVFFTVYYALKHLADLQPGERVLIHGAAGGVGIAAMQVARYLGAEIFATAGSDEKRDFVRLMGAEHVLNSRSLAYADEILAITGGQGVDVVLNSLAGEAINRNLRVLRPFGRFLELGKRDFYENTHIGLRPFKDNISYFGIDADQLMVARPAFATRIFREVMELFADGVLRPLPYRAFPAGQVVEAFRYMQQARQIGKVVVTLDAADVQVKPASRRSLPAPPALRADATYLVTGGLEGFGLESARWLAGLGAGHLVLLGRRGMRTPGVAEAMAALAAQGATVHVRACDVTDRLALEEVLAEIHRDLPPLRGILHAAMVLDDGLIRNLDADRFQRALAPKALGAWNLHQLTRDIPLDFFILYSSATTYIGNPGQANYVAANLYLESLAAMRRAEGLVATCVCWGGIGDVGYLSRHAAVKDGLQARLGGDVLTSGQALKLLGAMLTADRNGLAVMDFDWPSLGRYLPSARGHRFDSLRRAGDQHGADDGDRVEDIHSLIAGRTAEEARAIVAALLAGEVAQILQIPAERIDTARSLYDLGMDSLMGVELVLSIEKRFAVNLPVMALNEGPSIERIAERLVASLQGEDQPADEEVRIRDLVSTMAAQHAEEVSPEDVIEAVEAVRMGGREGARLVS